MIVAAPAMYRERLATALPGGVEARYYSGPSEAVDAVAGAEILWLALWSLRQSSPAVAAGTCLRWIHTNGAGVDFFPLDAIRERGIVLTNGSGLNSVPIAEAALMGMLAAARSLPALVRAQQGRRWAREEAGTGELNGSSALVIGMGSIGSAVGERLRALGVAVTGVRRLPAGEAGVLGPDDWRPRLPEFDWVILTAPLTPATRHLIGAAELGAMRPGAWLINMARGGLVDEPALAAALRSGRPAGAYLDATEREPPPADSPLWDLPNLILTPHISGVTRGHDARAVDMFVQQLHRYRTGEPMLNVVDLELGY